MQKLEPFPHAYVCMDSFYFLNSNFLPHLKPKIALMSPLLSQDNVVIPPPNVIVPPHDATMHPRDTIITTSSCRLETTTHTVFRQKMFQ